MTAALARDPNAAKLQEPASQVLRNLPHHETRQPTRLLRSLDKLLPVRSERPVQHRLFRSVTLVSGASCRVLIERGLSQGDEFIEDARKTSDFSSSKTLLQFERVRDLYDNASNVGSVADGISVLAEDDAAPIK